MEDNELKKIKIIIASFLHDIGKVIYREGKDQRNHSVSGYDFLKDEVKLDDEDILNSVRFHHAKELSSAQISDDSIAYIVYMADNIASATERRSIDTNEVGFDQHMPLSSVFNILNQNNKNLYLRPQLIDEGINNPSNECFSLSEEFYGSC